MIPLIRDFFKRLLWDKGSVVGWIRGAFLSGSVILVQGGIHWPPDKTWVTPILAQVAGMIRAGDKNLVGEPAKPVPPPAD